MAAGVGENDFCNQPDVAPPPTTTPHGSPPGLESPTNASPDEQAIPQLDIEHETRAQGQASEPNRKGSVGIVVGRSDACVPCDALAGNEWL
jgi:hypothetical protein